MSSPHRPALAITSLESRDVPAAPFETISAFPFNDYAVIDNARAIAAHGALLGRRADVFLKIGDSNTDLGAGFGNWYLKGLGSASYNPVATGLANYGSDMLDTWATYRTPIDGLGNSFNRSDTTAYPGFTALNVIPRLPAEIAATNAGVALVMLGTNDMHVYADPALYQANLQQIVNTLEDAGVVPILSTIPDSFYLGGKDRGTIRTYNQIVANLADSNRLPLWNLFSEEASLPFEGMDVTPYIYNGVDVSGLHLSVSPSGASSFSPVDLGYGQNVHTLGALTMLNWYRRQIVGPQVDMPAASAWTPVAAGESIYATGRGVGQAPIVSIFDSSTNTELTHFYAYEPSFQGGVQVATADVNGDGITDIITAPGAGGGPVVKVFSGTDGSLLASLMAFEPTFRTGVNVAAADLDGDGKAEVIVGAGNGGGPAIAVYHGGDLQEVARFFAYESTFRGGVNVAAAVLPNYGPSIVAGSGVGGGPVVKVFHYGDRDPVASFFVYDESARTGVNVAAGPITGYGAGEIVIAPGSDSTHVMVIDAATSETCASFFGGPATAPGGVKIAVVNGRLLVGNGPGESVSVSAYDGLSDQPTSLLPNDPLRAYGLDVG